MDSNKFWNTLTNAINIPFDEDDVISIEESCDTTYIDLENEDTYYININKCENDTDDS